MKKYLIKNHRWIIGTLLIPLIVFSYTKLTDFKKETLSFYFVGSESEITTNLDTASCWVNSLSTNRGDAFRCKTTKGIEDPCFRYFTDPDILICPLNPYKNNNYYKIDPLDKKLNFSASSHDEKRPWFIKLFSKNAECRFLTGATTGIANMRVDYGCENSDIEFLLLPIHQKDSLLQIGCYIDGRIETCDIKEAWY